MTRTRAGQQTAQRAGTSAEQRVDAAFRLIDAAIVEHHPKTTMLKGAWTRVNAGPCDRSGWVKPWPARAVIGAEAAIPVMFDVKHVGIRERLYEHPPKQRHQLDQLLEFSRGGKAGILILHDTPNEPGGRWLWYPVRTRADAEAAATGIALRDAKIVRQQALYPPVTLVSIDVPWYAQPAPELFRGFVAQW